MIGAGSGLIPPSLLVTLRSDWLRSSFCFVVTGNLSSLKMQSRGALIRQDFHCGSRDTLYPFVLPEYPKNIPGSALGSM